MCFWTFFDHFSIKKFFMIFLHFSLFTYKILKKAKKSQKFFLLKNDQKRSKNTFKLNIGSFELIFILRSLNFGSEVQTSHPKFELRPRSLNFGPEVGSKNCVGINISCLKMFFIPKTSNFGPEV